MKILVAATKMSKVQVAKLVDNAELSKSAKMKALFEAGMEIKEISTILGVRYNFVYNVISNHVTVNGVEIEKTKKAGKKEAIIELHVAGKTNKEISAELKSNYNYVYNVVKAYKASQEPAVVEGEVK